MSIPVATLRTNIRRSLGVDEYEPGFDNDGIDLLLNRTYWELQDKFHLRETESSTTLTTVAGTRELSLPATFESLRVSAYVDPDSDQHTKLDQMDLKTYESKYNSNADYQAPPTHYIRENATIILYPTPDDVYDIIIWYRGRLDDLSSGQEAQLPRSWIELLEYGALYRGSILLGDTDKMSTYGRLYTNSLATVVPIQSIEEDDNSMAGVQPIRSSYP